VRLAAPIFDAWRWQAVRRAAPYWPDGAFRGEVESHADAAGDRLEMQEVAVWFEVPPDACSATARGSVQRVDQVLDRVVGDVRRIDPDADAVDRERQPKPPVDGWIVVDADAWSGGQVRYLALTECTASTSAAT
jgi:hypothetical protein